MTLLKIPPDLPWFDGHFPGRSVLPGVAHLVLLDDLLRAAGRSMTGIARVRFRKEVLPGDEIEIETRDDESADSVRFAVRRGGEIVSDGLVSVGPAGAGRSSQTAAVPAPASEVGIPPIEMLVPHRGAMRFVEALIASTPDATSARARIPESSPFARAGLAPTVLAIEIAAQAAAAGEALARSRETGVAVPREGRLVGAGAIGLLAAGIPAGRPLVATIVLAHSVPPMAVYQATVADGGRVLATGTVSTYLV